jgi:hypothetical protein
MTLFSSFGNQIWFKYIHMNVKFARIRFVMTDFNVSTETGHGYPCLGKINLCVAVRMF